MKRSIDSTIADNKMHRSDCLWAPSRIDRYVSLPLCPYVQKRKGSTVYFRIASLIGSCAINGISWKGSIKYLCRGWCTNASRFAKTSHVGGPSQRQTKQSRKSRNRVSKKITKVGHGSQQRALASTSKRKALVCLHKLSQRTSATETYGTQAGSEVSTAAVIFGRLPPAGLVSDKVFVS